MRYLCLIYGDQSVEMSQDEWDAMLGQYHAFGTRHQAAIAGGDALQPATTATTIRVRDGQVLTTDGPFAEAREQLGGYYLISADDLDQAIAIAGEIPGAAHGAVEVRPVMDLPM